MNSLDFHEAGTRPRNLHDSLYRFIAECRAAGRAIIQTHRS